MLLRGGEDLATTSRSCYSLEASNVVVAAAVRFLIVYGTLRVENDTAANVRNPFYVSLNQFGVWRERGIG